MSGIVGIVNFDRAPVDQRLLRRMTDFMTFRGPDAQEIWVGGHVGFGHTLLKTTFEAEHEHQPFTLDGQVWIVADARVDAQRDLISKLESRGHEIVPGMTDVELILRSYQVWGEDCVEHLLGDFAFAIWDGSNERLFCARDHFGVKPFYYAQHGPTFLFSNTLNALRQHPVVDDSLNEFAIADFLLFEVNSDLHRTTFSMVWRIPPAHVLEISGERGARVKKFWTLSQGPEIRHSHPEDYVEHFTNIFDSAVGDRLRTNRISMPLSGGMDSSSIAATAKKLAGRNRTSLELHAHTYVYDRILPDNERYYAGLVAAHLKIPIQYQPLDDYGLFDGWEDPNNSLPEPSHNPTDALVRDHFANLASTGRVALSGNGGDPAFCPSRQYLGMMLKSGRWLEAARSFAFLWRTLGTFPPMGLRTLFRAERGRWAPPYPDWLNPEFERRLKLRDRWNSFWFGPMPEGPRAGLFESLAWPGWVADFERWDPGTTRALVEQRYPFFDKRVMEFCAALPPIPACVQKSLLRGVVQGLLPREVSLRLKSRLESNGMAERYNQAFRNWNQWSKPAAELANFAVIPKLISNADDYELWRSLVPTSLNWWLLYFENVTKGRGEVYEYQES